MTDNSSPDVVQRAKAAMEAKCTCCDIDPCGWQDMQFAGDCRALVPELVAEVERLRAAAEEQPTQERCSACDGARMLWHTIDCPVAYEEAHQ